MRAVRQALYVPKERRSTYRGHQSIVRVPWWAGGHLGNPGSRLTAMMTLVPWKFDVDLRITHCQQEGTKVKKESTPHWDRLRHVVRSGSHVAHVQCPRSAVALIQSRVSADEVCTRWVFVQPKFVIGTHGRWGLEFH